MHQNTQNVMTGLVEPNRECIFIQFDRSLIRNSGLNHFALFTQNTTFISSHFHSNKLHVCLYERKEKRRYEKKKSQHNIECDIYN